MFGTVIAAEQPTMNDLLQIVSSVLTVHVTEWKMEWKQKVRWNVLLSASPSFLSMDRKSAVSSSSFLWLASAAWFGDMSEELRRWSQSGGPRSWTMTTLGVAAVPCSRSPAEILSGPPGTRLHPPPPPRCLAPGSSSVCCRRSEPPVPPSTPGGSTREFSRKRGRDLNIPGCSRVHWSGLAPKTLNISSRKQLI